MQNILRSMWLGFVKMKLLATSSSTVANYSILPHIHKNRDVKYRDTNDEKVYII